MRMLFSIVGAAVIFSVSTSSAFGADSSWSLVLPLDDGAADAAVTVPEPSDQAMRYYRSGNWWWALNTLGGILIPALFLFTGLSAKIRDWARRTGKKWFPAFCLYVVAFLLLVYLIELPFSYYQDFVRQHAYGLSNQTFAKWFGDSLKWLAVGLVGGIAFLWIPYLLLKKSPRRWWLYSGLLAVPFLFFMMLISPIWIAPLFNDFGEMQDKALEIKILALAERAGIEGSRVFEVNKSVDTKAINAYVSGFGNTKRIVLWDTIIEKFDEQELLFVMGHEMGHFVLKHVIKIVLFFSALILIVLYLIYRSAGFLIDRYRQRFGFDELSDMASLPLLIMLVNVYFFVLTPAAYAFTRYNEHEADRFGLEITRANFAAATAFVKLQQQNLANPRPGPVFKFFRATHPTLGDRVDFCNTYRPWNSNQPLKYEHLFTRRNESRVPNMQTP